MSSLAHLYTWNVIKNQFSGFVILKMATYCVSCGSNISESKLGRRLQGLFHN